MELKVGDKIRLVGTIGEWIRGSEGVILEVRPPEVEYHYRVKVTIKTSNRSCHYPVRDNEIERVSVKGRQLEFAFMHEVDNEI